MSDCTPVIDGPLDGATAPNMEDAFTFNASGLVYVYERWPLEDGRDAFILAATLKIGDVRIGGDL
jgi:hypothetical protein